MEKVLPLDDKEPQVVDSVVLLTFPDTQETAYENERHLHVFKGIVANISQSRLILDARVLRGCSGGAVLSLETCKVIGVVSEVLLDSEEEEVELPSGEVQKQSVEGETLGIAIPAEFIKKLKQ